MGVDRRRAVALIKQAKRMRENGMQLIDIDEILGVGRTTLYRHLK
ncbi:helix-turn-helix domain-containing protein [Rhodococcus sp. BP22]|nr:helix-turn-helix domain-containing protein [Rhodococcus sp. BP22]